MSSRAIRARIAALESELPALGEAEVSLTGRLLAGEAIDGELQNARTLADNANRSLRHLTALLPNVEAQEREAAKQAAADAKAATRAEIEAAIETLQSEAAKLAVNYHERILSPWRKMVAAAERIRELLPPEALLANGGALSRSFGLAGLRGAVEGEMHRQGGCGIYARDGARYAPGCGPEHASGPDAKGDPARGQPLGEAIAERVGYLLRVLDGERKRPAEPAPERHPRDMGRLPDAIYGYERRKREDEAYEEALAHPPMHGGVPLARPTRPVQPNPWD